MLGDIGGLFDALRALGIIFVISYELIFGSVFEKYILSKIFLMEKGK